MKRVAIAALLLLVPAPATAGGAAKAIVEVLHLTTYTATRKEQDFYEIAEGYVVKTRYCYAYAYSEDVVLTKEKIIFIGSNDVCDVEAIYTK